MYTRMSMQSWNTHAPGTKNVLRMRKSPVLEWQRYRAVDIDLNLILKTAVSLWFGPKVMSSVRQTCQKHPPAAILDRLGPIVP